MGDEKDARFLAHHSSHLTHHISYHKLTMTATASRLFTFVGGDSGPWRVRKMVAVVGEALAPVERVDIVAGLVSQSIRATWLLRGVTSNERYVTREEKQSLLAKQQGLGRAESTLAALIPIRKNSA